MRALLRRWRAARKELLISRASDCCGAHLELVQLLHARRGDARVLGLPGALERARPAGAGGAGVSRAGSLGFPAVTRRWKVTEKRLGSVFFLLSPLDTDFAAAAALVLGSADSAREACASANAPKLHSHPTHSWRAAPWEPPVENRRILKRASERHRRRPCVRKQPTGTVSATLVFWAAWRAGGSTYHRAPLPAPCVGAGQRPCTDALRACGAHCSGVVRWAARRRTGSTTRLTRLVTTRQRASDTSSGRQRVR